MHSFVRLAAPFFLTASFFAGAAGCAAPTESPTGSTAAAVTDADPCNEHEQTFEGREATKMLQALLFAHVAPTSHTGNDEIYTNEWKLTDVECTEVHFLDDNIPRYSCKSPSIADDAQAMVFADAMDGLGVYSEGGMGHVWYTARSLSCKLEVGNDGTKHSCAVTAVWSTTCK